jgi:dihydroorotate dehydrogenase
MYRTLIQPALFALDPETAHNTLRTIAQIVNLPSLSRALGRVYTVDEPRLAVSVGGLKFKNPVGLAAGFDKNAELLGLWAALGFGHIELGTVTARRQPGNPRPRIFRLTADRALINRMGFPSEGADVMEQRLSKLRSGKLTLPPIGINIGKSKEVELDQAIQDYCYSLQKLAPFADYIAVNISSPNTPNLRQLQDKERLSELLAALTACNVHNRPIFVKVAPDLTFSALEEVVRCCFDNGIAGIIATNTTLGREGLKTKIEETGGLSGSPITKRALEVVLFLGSTIDRRMALIGVGGVFSGKDALAMLCAGASLVQIYTGLIYEGPGLVRAINRYLVEFMESRGCKNLQEAAIAWRDQLVA